MIPDDEADRLRRLDDEALGLLAPGRPDPVPPWHRPRVRQPFGRRLAVWAVLVVLSWTPVGLFAWYAASH